MRDIAELLAEVHRADVEAVRVDTLQTVALLAELGLVADARTTPDRHDARPARRLTLSRPWP